MDAFKQIQENYLRTSDALENIQTNSEDTPAISKIGFKNVGVRVNNAIKVFWSKLKTFFLRNKPETEETDEAQELFGFGKKEEDKAIRYRKHPNAATDEILAWLSDHRQEIVSKLSDDEFLVDVGDDQLQKLNTSIAMDIKEKSWEHGSPLIALQYSQKGKPVAILGIMKASLTNFNSPTVSFGYLTTVYDGIKLRTAIETNTWPSRMSVTLVYHPLWSIDNPGFVGAINKIVIVGACEYTLNK